MAQKTTIKLSPKLSSALSKAFLALSSSLGKYRSDHWDDLTNQERKQLEDIQWTLFNTSSDLNAYAVILKTKLIGKDLATLKQAAGDMIKAADKIKNIKHAIVIATKAVILGGAIATGNAPVIVTASADLIAEINS